jgi:hypothetical protein
VPSSHPQTTVCSREGCQSSAVTGLSKRMWYRSWPVETFQIIKEWSSEPDAKNSPEEENSRQLTLSEWAWESVCFRMYAYDMRDNIGWTQTNKSGLYFNFLLRCIHSADCLTVKRFSDYEGYQIFPFVQHGLELSPESGRLNSNGLWLVHLLMFFMSGGIRWFRKLDFQGVCVIPSRKR